MTWTKGSRVSFKDDTIPKFLNELAAKAGPQGYKIYVTSGYRSPYDQARVVCNNFHNTNGANLSIYGSKTQNMYRQYCPSNDLKSLEAYEAERLAANLARDPNYQGHGTGLAVDLSVSGLSEAQKRKLKSLIESMGAQVLWERSPEHFHVYVRNWKPSNVIDRIAPNLPRWAIYTSLSVVLLSMGVFGYQMYKRR